jgi:hypothetical protein
MYSKRRPDFKIALTTPLPWDCYSCQCHCNHRIIMCVYLRQCSVHRLVLLFGLCPHPLNYNWMMYISGALQVLVPLSPPPTWPYKFLHLDHCSGNTVSFNCMTETGLKTIYINQGLGIQILRLNMMAPQKSHSTRWMYKCRLVHHGHAPDFENPDFDDELFTVIHIYLQISEHNWGGGDATNKQTNNLKSWCTTALKQTKMMGMDRLSGNIWW